MTDVSQDKMGTNWIGLYTMVRREVSRMMSPSVTSRNLRWVIGCLRRSPAKWP